MEREFEAEIIEWRGPAPFIFARLPEAEADLLKELSPMISYGWGCIACSAAIGNVEFTTALMPHAGGYVLPLKNAVRKPEQIEVGDAVQVRLNIDVSLP